MYVSMHLILQPIPRAKSGSLDSTHISSESNLIWDKDMQDIIKDVKLRDRIAQRFNKTPDSECELCIRIRT